jgi:hypothetical protein
LSKLGFHGSKCDTSLFIPKSGKSSTYLLLYVDDIILTASSNHYYRKGHLQRFVTIISCGLLTTADDPLLIIQGHVVFDEDVFPFSTLHPNVGAHLRAEIDLLPPSLRTTHRLELEVDHRANGADPTTESLDVQGSEESSIGAPNSNVVSSPPED